MKYSIVIPVYNVGKYIDKCLNSVVKQSYKNYEVIIVNDGTEDNSIEIINKYIKKYDNFKLYSKENGGLSIARNYGVNYITGDYLLFIDSDDYIEKDLLLNLNQILEEKKYDLIKFKLRLVDDKENFIRDEKSLDTSREVSINDIFSNEFCEPACTYCYNVEFWKDNNFKYAKGKIHEDFGLTPEIIMSARNIFFLNYVGYNYVQRANSITTTVSIEKNIKKAYDLLEQYDRLINLKFNNENYIHTYKSFLANSVINKSRTLKGSLRENILMSLEKEKYLIYYLRILLKKNKKNSIKDII